MTTPNRIYGTMSLGAPATKLAHQDIRLKVPFTKVDHQSNLVLDPFLSRATLNYETPALVFKYNLIFKTGRNGSLVEVPIEVGVVVNSDLAISRLAAEPYQVDASTMGLRGSLVLSAGYSREDKLDFIIINRGVTCNIEFKNCTLSIFDGLGALIPGMGPGGDPGSFPALGYVHIQGVPSTDWIIVHNLSFIPNVTVVDTTEVQCEGEVKHLNESVVQVRFSIPFSGKAYLS